MIKLRVRDSKTVQAELGTFNFDMPICRIPNTDQHIIAFDSMGKQDIIMTIGRKLARMCSDSGADIIVCPEAKAIPLAQELSYNLGRDYFVLRKAKKLYMSKPQSIEVKSITTEGSQKLWFDEEYVNSNLRGQRAILFDDVVSTGSSFKALETFAEQYGINVVDKVTVFVEGDSFNSDYVKYLGRLPILTGKELKDKVGENL